MALNNSKFQNKRNYIRMDVRAEIKCKNIETGEEFSGACKNLSHTGIKFETSKHIKKGTKLQITVNVNGDRIKPLKATLSVIRIEKLKHDKYNISGELRDVH